MADLLTAASIARLAPASERAVAGPRPAAAVRAAGRAPAGADARPIADDSLGRILARTCRARAGVLQRKVMDGRDVVLDQQSPTDVRASVAYDFIERACGGRAPFSFELCERVVARSNDLREAVDGPQPLTRADYANLVFGRAWRRLLVTHQRFLDSFAPLANDPSFRLVPLQGEGDTAQLPHYAALDRHFGGARIIWRFTSKPAEERIFIRAGTPPKTIVKRIAEHSGGNNKRSTDVQTLSFGRNIAALFGTAMSGGGDPNVLDIINKADYLYGIEIDSLPGKGISAHPAAGRAISLFETEYVLLGTPGEPPWTLEQLATHRYRNPFKRNAAEFAQRHGFKRAMKPTEPLDSSEPLVFDDLSATTVEAIKAQALKVAGAADRFRPTIQYLGYITRDQSEYSLASVLDDVQRFAREVLAGSHLGGLSGKPWEQLVTK